MVIAERASDGAAGAWSRPEPVVPEGEVRETVETEILIVGAGTAGMMAAIVAGKRNARTLVIEKNARVGYYKTYNGAVGSRAQQAAGPKAAIDNGEVIRELVRYPAQYDEVDKRLIEHTNAVDEELVRLWADESGATVDFLANELAEYGVRHVAEYDTGDGLHGQFRIFPTHTKFLVPVLKGGPKARVHGGVGVIEPLLVKRAKGYGVQFRFETPLVKLVKEGGRVVGALAVRKGGGYLRINASRGVLLCSGGYSDDHATFANRNPQATAVTTVYYGQAGNTGDGIKAAVWAGADADRFGTAGLFDRGITKPGGKAGLPFRRLSPLLGPLDAFHMGSQPFLKVNLEGKRFINESVPYDVSILPLEHEKHGVLCAIWDAKYWDNIEQFRLAGCCRQLPSPSRPRTYEGISKPINRVLLARASMKGFIQKANTIEELARKLQLPVATFKATVERYNQMARAGLDQDFGKPAKDLIPLETPPFYGATNAGWMMHTTDGVRINADMQVVDGEGHAIAGLYAAGDTAGGFFGTNYYPELVVGIASGKTITFARHAVLHMTGAI
jgi:succinate dehydrogenase/fumarate reductase flavoprotein subunit